MKSKIITVIITIIFSLIAVAYAFGIIKFIKGNNVSKILTVIVVIAFVLVIYLLIWNMYKRFKEIEEEDKNDIGKY